MEHAKWEMPIRGVVIGVIYCLAYLAGWFNSLDQWFLPAGVRIGALLLSSYRYWPYLLAGDFAALFLLRVPGASEDRETWAYASSILLPVSIALPLICLRLKFRLLADQAKWLPLIAATLAIWGALSNSLINSLLDGPPTISSDLEYFYRRCVGHFLAIISITSLGILWLSRGDDSQKPKHFLRDALVSGATLVLIFCLIVIPEKIGDYLRIGLLLMMLLPIIFMTLRHGWRGAALGLAATCFAVAKTLYYFNSDGAYDAPVFIVQHTLVIAAFGLLALGHTISSQYSTARSLGISESEAIQAARTSFLASEPMLRDKALTMKQMQLRIESERKRVADYLKSIGDFEGALLLNNEAVEHNSRFGAYVTDIYPLRLEEHGLNAVLNSKEFSDARGNGAHVLPLLGSNPTHLSLDLQLMAYRCAGNAIDVLSELEPRAYVIKTRIRKGIRRRGIALIVMARNPTQSQSTAKSAQAAIELTARVKAHGGIVKRRHAQRISIWLAEPIKPPASDQ